MLKCTDLCFVFQNASNNIISTPTPWPNLFCILLSPMPISHLTCHKAYEQHIKLHKGLVAGGHLADFLVHCCLSKNRLITMDGATNSSAFIIPHVANVPVWGRQSNISFFIRGMRRCWGHDPVLPWETSWGLSWQQQDPLICQKII